MKRRVEQLQQFVINKREEALANNKSSDAIMAYNNVMKELEKMLSPYIYVIQYKDLTFFAGENGKTKFSLQATVFELDEQAEDQYNYLVKQGVECSLITIPKENCEKGNPLFGYCDGFFGNNNGLKIVEEVHHNRIVVRVEDSGELLTGYFEAEWQEKYRPLLIQIWKGDLEASI